MIIYPAIDMKDGKCVRLLRGDFSKATIFNNSPAEQAKAFVGAGFKWLHLVDLDGAVEGRPVNESAVKEVLNTVNIPVQLGGGIRSIAQVEAWLDAGISRVILGTVALKNPDMVREAAKRYPGKVAVGIDAKQGMVAVEGWLEKSSVSAMELAQRFEDAGVSAIIYTDIARDGALLGPNIEETALLAATLSIPVILSGGVSSEADLKAIAEYSKRNIEGVIIGRALYESTITAEEALRYQ